MVQEYSNFGWQNVYCITHYATSVLRKVIKLISRHAELEASNEASLKQAQNVSDHCQKVMEENEKLKKVCREIIDV